MKNWDKEENPMREHQKLSETCGFVCHVSKHKVNIEINIFITLLFITCINFE